MWDDEVELTEEDIPLSPGISRIPPRSPEATVTAQTPPLDLRASKRRHSVTDFPPPMRRVSSEHSRPVSFSAKFTRVHPATTGVTVLEHMERLDAVEAGLKRLGIEEDDPNEEEVDVGTVRPKATKKKQREQRPQDGESASLLLSPSAQSERLSAVPEVDSATLTDDAASVAEEDLVAMSKSMPQLEQSPTTSRWTSPAERPNLDWMDIDSATSPRRRIVIAEVSFDFMPSEHALTATHIYSAWRPSIPNPSSRAGDHRIWTNTVVLSLAIFLLFQVHVNKE